MFHCSALLRTRLRERPILLLAITPIRKKVHSDQEDSTNHQVNDNKEREEHGAMMPPHAVPPNCQYNQ
jgi:hypothetical protein